MGSETNDSAIALSVDGFPLPHGLSFPIRLSQGQLNLLATCPRKFQHTYLEQLATPTDPDQQERLTWGARFHLLVQQWQMGLPIEPILQAETQLQPWFHAFRQAAPQIMTLGDDPGIIQYHSEHMQTLAFQGYLLTVVYDLLLTDHHQAKILDWKTYPRPVNARSLAQNWQTRLYPFVLAETTPYPPKHIAMTYWFFQSRTESMSSPRSLTFAHNAAQHEQTRQDLTLLLNQLTIWLERYQEGEPFPQVSVLEPCDRCSFAVKCDRVMGTGDRSPTLDTATTAQPIAMDATTPLTPYPYPNTNLDLPDLATIPEVPL